MTHPEGGHPEPAPEPPPPIPPDDPIPVPGPPQDWPPRAAGADFIDAPPDPTAKVFPPPGSFPDERAPATADLSPAADLPPAADLSPATADLSPATAEVPAAHETAEQAAVGPELTQVIPAAPDYGWPGAPPAPTPAPTSAWHAQHEAAGQWQHSPPEQSAWPQHPPADGGTPTAPIWSSEQPPHQPAEPWQQPWPQQLTEPAPPRRRGALWVSLALVATLLLCGGGAVSAYYLLRDADTPGSPDPATAVNRFLTAVYSQQDATSAEQFVCREARDQTKLTDRVNEVKTYANGYTDPVFRWGDPAVSDQSSDRATVSVQLTMSTGDEKTAQQNLRFTVIHKTGWLVCEVTG